MVMFENRSIAPASRAGTVTAEMKQQGKPVRYLCSTFVSSEEKSFRLLDAPSAERVREATELARLPMQRIVEVARIAADDLA